MELIDDNFGHRIALELDTMRIPSRSIRRADRQSLDFSLAPKPRFAR
jgi:hypothetical protein